MPLLHRLERVNHELIFRLGVAAIFAAVIVAIATKARALSRSGSIAAFAVGTAAYGFGQFAVAVPLIAFFLSGTMLSRIRNARAAGARAIAQKGSTRDALQVLANGGAAGACAMVSGFVSPDIAARWLAAAIGTLAVAAADTWATELGILAKSRPRSILSGSEVAPGESGGVTLEGFLASLAGGAFIGAVAAPFAPYSSEGSWIVFGAVVGFAGSAVDSILGASVQGKWRCKACAVPCEASIHRCGNHAVFAGGLRLVDNDGVNVISTAAGAVLGWLAFALIR